MDKPATTKLTVLSPTPGPWRIESYQNHKYPDLYEHTILADVAEFDGRTCSILLTGLDSIADAELIVRAVNAHDDLVFIVENALEWFAELATGNQDGLWQADLTDQLRAALAKAKGGE